MDSLLQQTATDMSTQHEATNAALEKNVQNTKSAKAMLEDQLNKVWLQDLSVFFCLNCMTQIGFCFDETIKSAEKLLPNFHLFCLTDMIFLRTFRGN